MKAVDQGELDLARAAAVAQGQSFGGPFSPGIPLTPFDGVSGLPRAWNFQTGYNLKARADRDGRIDFSLLKAMRDSYDVAMMCINHRIDDVRSLPYSIRSADWVVVDNPEEIDAANKAMRRPDGHTPFRAWLAMFLLDTLSYDAGTLYKRRNLGGACCGLEVISGTTIAPVLDYWGRTPLAPAPAYVQYVEGQPWEWLTTDDIIYVPFRPQSDSPYGMSPLETVLLTANTDLRFQKHFLDWFTEGNVPEGFATAPETVTTPEQLEKWEAYWEAMNTYSEVKHKMKMVPHGTVLSFPQEKGFDSAFPLYLMRKVCAAFHVTPNDLGFTEDVNRATGDTQVDVQFRIGTLPLVQHVQDILTSYLQDDLGLAVVFEFDTGQEKEDRLATAQADDLYIKNGTISVDEVRVRQFGLASDAERPTPRFIFSARQGPIPLRSILDVAGPIDPETAAPSDLAPLDVAPFEGSPGVLADKSPGAPQFAKAPTDPDDPRNPGSEIPVPGSGLVGTPPPAPAAPAAGVPVVKAAVTVAGVAVKAADTGRVLMIQRVLDVDDPAAGSWEFPGGHLEEGESAYGAAVREWQEETGLVFPQDAVMVGGWSSPDGHYVGHVVKTANEFSIGSLDGEDSESLAWFHPDDLPGFPALRDELAANLPSEELAKAITRELSQWRNNTVTRLQRGKTPRPFQPSAMSEELVEAVWKQLRHVQTREQADVVFDQIRKVGPRTQVAPSKWTPLDPKGGASNTDPVEDAAQVAQDAVDQEELDNQEDIELGDLGSMALSADVSDAVAFDEAITYGDLKQTQPSSKVRSETGEGPTPQQQIDKIIADHWAPILAGSLGAILTDEQIKGLCESITDLAQADEEANAEHARHMAEAKAAFGALKGTLTDMWQAAYTAGRIAADVSMMLDSHPSVAQEWKDWTPETVNPQSLHDLGWLSVVAGKDLAIKGLQDTTLDGIAGVLSRGVIAGDSVDKMAANINGYLNDPKRAHMIAQTESARMLTTASISSYRAAGLTQYDLVTSSGACPICLSLAEGNPYNVYDASALVPDATHPNCRCSIAPTEDAKASLFPVDDGLEGEMSSSPDLSPEDKAAAAQSFHTAFEGAMAGSPFTAFVSHYSVDEIAGMRDIVMMDNGKAGMLVKDHGDGRVEGSAVFNQSGDKNVGRQLLDQSVSKYGVNYVECYGPFLPQVYGSLGFKTVEQYPFDRSMAADDWNYDKFGEPDYNMMTMKGQSYAELAKQAGIEPAPADVSESVDAG